MILCPYFYPTDAAEAAYDSAVVPAVKTLAVMPVPAGVYICAWIQSEQNTHCTRHVEAQHRTNRPCKRPRYSFLASCGVADALFRLILYYVRRGQLVRRERNVRQPAHVQRLHDLRRYPHVSVAWRVSEHYRL